MSALAKKIVALHEALSAKDIPHAFGGALALAWCTGRARATIDIDINVFVDPAMSKSVLAALPRAIKRNAETLASLHDEGQVRCWWQQTPVDIFLNSTPFHAQLQSRIQHEQFYGATIPFLGCTDLAVFKAFFNRTRDWADIEEMVAADTVDLDAVAAVLREYLGAGDPRVATLLQLRQ